MFLVTRVVIPSSGQMTHGFIGYYTASLLVVQGKFGPLVYDNAWFSHWVHAVSQRPIDEALAPGLPTEALVALPVVFLPPQPARAAWLWGNVLLLLVALSLLIATLYQLHPHRPQPVLWLLLAALAFMFPPVFANFFLGQAYLLLLALFSLALYGLASQRNVPAGLGLGLAFILKSSGLPLWLLLLLQRRWPALAWGVATMLLVAVMSLPWLGIAIWRLYPQVAWGVADGPTLSVTAYQTTLSFFNHLFRFDPAWNPQPLVHWPWLAQTLTLLVTAGASLVTVWLGQTATLPLLFAALSTLSVVVFPAAEEYQYTLLLMPIFILVDHLCRTSCQLVLQDHLKSGPDPPAPGSGRLDWFLLSAALVWLMVPIPYEDKRLSAGWLALLAYPRLFGGWLLWTVAIRQMRRPVQAAGLVEPVPLGHVLSE